MSCKKREVLPLHTSSPIIPALFAQPSTSVGDGHSAPATGSPSQVAVQMSVVDDDSPMNSSSSDDFAAFLETELESTSDSSSELNEDDNETYHSDINRTKRQKIEVLESVDSSVKESTCTHPGIIGGMCIKCGQKMDNLSGVPFGYIHKDLRLANDEITRLRDRDLKNLFSHKKLCLVLDLDLTLLNSSQLRDVTQEEQYYMNQNDALKSSLFKLDSIRMVTKLRPFVHTFLKEANELFEMYIYTKGERFYALEMAKLLDPKKVYFDSRVISQNDCTHKHQKRLDVVPVKESAVLILDDTADVWMESMENLILIDRYCYFASSCKQFGNRSKSLSELKSDESDVDGALARVLQLLKRIHNIFFDPELGDNFTGRDVRKVLGRVRGEILKGCKIVFSLVEDYQVCNMAELLGATCVTDVDVSVTHVVSKDVGTGKSRWAVKEKKFLVDPQWLRAANYLWERQPDEMFPVMDMENKE